MLPGPAQPRPRCMDPLAHIPHLAAMFVDAPYDTVVAAEFADARAGMVDEDGTRHWWTFHLLRGAAARPGERFGPEIAAIRDHPDRRMRGDGTHVATVGRHFPLRGAIRLSRVRSAPRYTMVEDPLHRLMPLTDQMRSERYGAEIISVSSTIGRDMPADIPPVTFGVDLTQHLRVVRGSKVRRSVAAFRDLGRWKWSDEGDPLPFEDLAAYRRRSKRQRLTRAMLFDYLGHLGIDAEGVFGRGEVEDPVLITTDHEGEALMPLRPGAHA
ncbi:MAG: hypothetical protein AAF371_10505 [Pseudomonadota bacterium]